MSINVKDLAMLLGEYNSLSNKARLTKADETRCAYLQTAIAAVKSGVSLREVDETFHNERARAAGLPEVRLPGPLNTTEKEARMYQDFVHGEKRDMTEGAPMISQVGSYTSLGYFVPSDFFPQVFTAMKAADALMDETAVTLIKSTNGRPLPVPVASDVENNASVIGEGGTQTSIDIDSTGHVVLGAYSYASRRFVSSLEAFDDIEGAVTVTGLMKQFFAQGLSRGIGADLISGNGASKPTGLVTTLENLVLPITATGSSNNTGGVETGVNSIGSADIAAMYEALDSAYFGPKTAWMCNQKTLGYLASGIITKYGQPLDLVKYVDGQPTMLGLPIKISPSLANISASSVPLLLGDFSYWVTRLIVDDKAGLVVYKEAPGLIEQGNIGMRSFCRADGNLAWTDTSSPAPIQYLRMHS
jgi:HK97 family phage major capsid protein